jgi:hypothetical protein
MDSKKYQTYKASGALDRALSVICAEPIQASIGRFEVVDDQ